MVSIISNSVILLSLKLNGFFATVDRGSVMARIHRWSVMIYGTLQAEFMETKCNRHIHRCGTSIFGKFAVYISTSINNNNQIFGGCKHTYREWTKCTSFSRWHYQMFFPEINFILWLIEFNWTFHLHRVKLFHPPILSKVKDTCVYHQI